MNRPFDYYAKGAEQLTGLSANSGAPALAQQLSASNRAWLILSQDQFVDPQGKLLAWFNQQYKLQSSWEYYEIKVNLYQLR